MGGGGGGFGGREEDTFNGANAIQGCFFGFELASPCTL